MKLKEIYNLAVELGIKNDPREKAEIQEELANLKKKYEKLSSDEKEEFDQESLENPYSDTRILHDNGSKVKTILVGIDAEAGEILLAKELERAGKKIDLVVSHHPTGTGLMGLSGVMPLMADHFAKHGVPINVAQGVLAPRIAEIMRAIMPANAQRSVDVAKILDVNYMCTHTIADNHACKFAQNIMDTKKPKTVGEVLKLLKEIPEFKLAIKQKAGPTIVVGSPERKAGKVVALEFTGGTSYNKEVYAKLATAGVGTIISMHISEDNKKEAEANFINVVVAGHIASDSLGMNLFLDELEKKGIEIVPCGGLIRVSRV